MGLAWWLAGLLCFVSLIGIPWGRACFVIGTFTFFPFGKQAVSRKAMTGQSDIGTGTLGLIGNILWFVLIGIWLALVRLLRHPLSADAAAIFDRIRERFAAGRGA